MTRVGIMQPYFFPYLGYYQLIAHVDKFVIYDDVAFIKQGWINRNRIQVNRTPHTFSIPVKDVSSFRLIKDTELDDRLFPKWKTKFLKTLELEYRKAPNFQGGMAMVENVLNDESKYIARLAVRSLVEVISYLGLRTQLIETSTGYGNDSIKGKDRLVDICKRELASHYVNVPGGKELYSKKDFGDHGIELQFITPVLKPYPQFSNDFLPALSMIDVIMFNTKEKIRELIESFQIE